MTSVQKAVCDAKACDGYVKIGKSASLLNGLDLIVMTKGKHTIAINTLGYDEHTGCKTWRIHE